jgi:hypothetical protein
MLDAAKTAAQLGAIGRGSWAALRNLLNDMLGELDSARTKVSLAVSTTLYPFVHGNKTILMSGAGSARTFTLPAATGSGVKFKFVVAEVNTSNYLIKVANATDVMDGSIFMDGDEAADVTTSFSTGATSDTITLNGTTTGGVSIGDWVELQDIASGQWSVTGLVTESGVEATPFSATVA